MVCAMPTQPSSDQPPTEEGLLEAAVGGSLPFVRSFGRSFVRSAVRPWGFPFLYFMRYYKNTVFHTAAPQPTGRDSSALLACHGPLGPTRTRWGAGCAY